MNAKIDNADLAEIRATINTFKYGAKLVISRATNDSLSGLKTESVRLIGQKVALKAAVIRETFYLKKTTVADLSAHIENRSFPIPLIEFQATDVKKGVSVRILRSKPKFTVPHAKIMTMRSGHRGVFWRAYTGKRVAFDPTKVYGNLYKTKYSLPIFELWGPRIPDIFDDPDIMEPVLKNANVRLQERLEHHTNQLIESAK